MHRSALFLALASALPASAPALANDSGKPLAGQAGGSADPVICRREVPVGSLIASRKICLTKSQWVERETRGNEEARKQAYDNTSKNPTPSN